MRQLCGTERSFAAGARMSIATTSWSDPPCSSTLSDCGCQMGRKMLAFGAMLHVLLSRNRAEKFYRMLAWHLSWMSRRHHLNMIVAKEMQPVHNDKPLVLKLPRSTLTNAPKTAVPFNFSLYLLKSLIARKREGLTLQELIRSEIKQMPIFKSDEFSSQIQWQARASRTSSIVPNCLQGGLGRMRQKDSS